MTILQINETATVQTDAEFNGLMTR